MVGQRRGSWRAGLSLPMRITFVLPFFPDSPVGGVRVCYEYANRLARRGHDVTLVHPAWNLARRPTSFIHAAKMLAKRALTPVRMSRIRAAQPSLSAAVAPGVRLALVDDLRPRSIPQGDVVIATSWETAEWLVDCPPSCGVKYYFIQGYETWGVGEARLLETWRMPYRKIVISKWLRDQAEVLGERAVWAPNGLDFDVYRLKTPIESRAPLSVAMIAHPLEFKGTADGLAALAVVKPRFPGLNATLFGTEKRPRDIPAWIAYERMPSTERIVDLYNGASIFLHTSWSEGWSLPCVESMACGCALVAAANSGVLNYACDERNALLAPIRQPNLLARQLVRLLEDPALRVSLARAGERSVRHFTWDRSTDIFEQAVASESAWTQSGELVDDTAAFAVGSGS